MLGILINLQFYGVAVPASEVSSQSGVLLGQDLSLAGTFFFGQSLEDSNCLRAACQSKGYTPVDLKACSRIKQTHAAFQSLIVI